MSEKENFSDEQLNRQNRYIDTLINPKFKINFGKGETWEYEKTCESCIPIAYAMKIFKEEKIYLGEEGQEIFVCPECGFVFRIEGVE